MKTAVYIITLLVDGKEWNSRPIKGLLHDAIDIAREQHRISRFYGKKAKNVEFKKATLSAEN